MVELKEGENTWNDYRTIAKKISQSKEGLLGSSIFQGAQIDQWLEVAHFQIAEASAPIVGQMFGWQPAD